MLNGMAQPDLFYIGIFRGNSPGVDCHRVDVLEKQGVRAHGLHIFADGPQMRHSSKAAHDAAYAQSIRDGLAKSKFPGYFEIRDRAGLIPADLEGDDHKIRAIQRRALIGMGGDGRWHPEGRDDFLGDHLRFSQTRFIYVHQSDMRLPKGRALQTIADDIAHENG